MKAKRMHVDAVAGRVVVGPKKLRGRYFRIVSQRNGSGQIERFDVASGGWSPAPESITFSDLWSAPDVPKLLCADLIAESDLVSPSEAMKSKHR